MRPDPIAALAESWGREMDSAPCDRVARFATPAADRIEAAAIAKRDRKAAKRAEDERRTAEGRATYTPPAKLGWRTVRWADGSSSYEMAAGWWDAVASGFAGWPDYEAPLPQWKWRYRERRALPGMERPWFARYKGCQRLYTLIRRVGQGRFRALVLRGVL